MSFIDAAKAPLDDILIHAKATLFSAEILRFFAALMPLHHIFDTSAIFSSDAITPLHIFRHCFRLFHGARSVILFSSFHRLHGIDILFFLLRRR